MSARVRIATALAVRKSSPSRPASFDLSQERCDAIEPTEQKLNDGLHYANVRQGECESILSGVGLL